MQSTRTCIIGIGGMARYHIRQMLELGTEIVVVSDPSLENYELMGEIFSEADLPIPPNETNLQQLLNDYGDQLDTAMIITPHALHFEQAKMCLEAGLDVLLEKPMVMNAQEAEALIDIRDKTGKLLVVAFQGGLSPEVRTAARMLQSGELGELMNISGTVWQNWRSLSMNTWRQMPELSGGGFMFDTGAHMLNTICDLVGEDFTDVMAWLDNRGAPVDIVGAIMGKTQSGTMVTINACGDTIPSCASEIMVFCTKGILRTGMWGERLLIQHYGETEMRPVPLPKRSGGAWEQFLLVREGQIENPCPPEVGLRMARLWDAIQESAHRVPTPVA